MTYDKDYYISEISNRSNRYGDELLRLMDETNTFRLSDVTLAQAKSFYEKLVEKEKNEE